MRRPNSRDPRPDVASGLRGPRRDADGRHAVGARAPTGPDTYFGLTLSRLQGSFVYARCHLAGSQGCH